MDARDLIGSWEQVSTEAQDPQGKTVETNTRVTGLLIYAPDGHVAVSTASPADGAKPATFMSYAGRFDVAGDTVKHHIRFSSNAKLVGSTQLRQARLDGNRLYLTANPSTSGGRAVITWRRAAR
jgi:hypothetical protein